MKLGEAMIYVTSDVHGRLDRLKKLIETIKLNSNDKLIILGDLVDRGEEPIEVIEFVLEHPQIEVIMGNHDEMMLHSLKYKNEIQIERWSRNGCQTTIEGFEKRDHTMQNKILEFVENLPYFKIIDDKYLLVHAGFEMDRLFEDMKNTSLEEALLIQKDRLVWVRESFFKNKALDGIITIFGHSPSTYINRSFGNENKYPNEIWFDKTFEDKIGIDVGTCYENGRLACIRLYDHKIYYVE